MPKPDLPDSPILVERASDVSGGVVDVSEEHAIGPNQAVYLLNVETTFPGERRRRRGVFPRGTPGGETNPNGAFAFEDRSHDFHHVLVQQGNTLWSTDGAGESFATRASGVSLYDTIHHSSQGRGATGIATAYWHSCVPYSANVSLPFDPLLAVGRDWTATLIQDVRPRTTAWYQSRLWAFNSAATLHGQDVLAWSNVLDGRNWSNGQSLRVDPDGGDPGVALVPLRTSERAGLLLFKERSIHALDIWWDTDGAFPNSQNTLDFANGARLRPIVTRTGAVATRGLVWVPGLQGGDVLFLSREGIRSLNRSATDAQGGAGIPLSFPIQKTIDRINWATADKAAAWYWDNRAYFSLPVDGSTENNFVLSFNTLNQSWAFLDWQANAFVDAKIDSQRKFFFLAQSTGSAGQSTVTLGHHLFEADRGLDDPYGEAVRFEEQTRAYTFPDDGNPYTGLQFRKIWRDLFLKFQVAATTATLTVNYKVDDGTDWNLLTHVSAAPEDAYPFLPAPLPFTLDSGVIIHKPVSLHSVRSGYRLQLQLLDDTSRGRFNIMEMRLRATKLHDTFS